MREERNQIETRRIEVDPEMPDPEAIGEAAAVIRAGGLVAFPTETVYGLGANALDADAVHRIFAAKERPAADPIIVHVAGEAALPQLAAALPPLAHDLAARFWPGPLTLVLPRGSRVPPAVTGGADTVAVRCPQHAVALNLIEAAGTPIAAPSANRFSRTSPTTATHVWEDLAGRIDLLLDGGPCTVGIESTVLDITGPVPTVLRPGGITLEALRATLGRVDLAERFLREGELAPSPGMLERHYAPRARLILFSGADDAVRAAVRGAVARAERRGEQVALLLAEEDTPALAGLGVTALAVGSLTNMDDVARNLFWVLRELDATHPDVILARDFPGAGLGVAVRDRLRRAAAEVVVV
jgi:L-threonylcarbamoyladenylate synthase